MHLPIMTTLTLETGEFSMITARDFSQQVKYKKKNFKKHTSFFYFLFSLFCGQCCAFIILDR